MTLYFLLQNCFEVINDIVSIFEIFYQIKKFCRNFEVFHFYDRCITIVFILVILGPLIKVVPYDKGIL